MKKVKYRAVVKTNRNGARLFLYQKIWFFWFPVQFYGRYINDSIWFVIDEDLRRWKKYYGDKMELIDYRYID